MKGLCVIFKPDEDPGLNEKTLECFRKQTLRDGVRYIFLLKNGTGLRDADPSVSLNGVSGTETNVTAFAAEHGCTILRSGDQSIIGMLPQILQLLEEEELVTFVEGGDTFVNDYFTEMAGAIDSECKKDPSYVPFASSHIWIRTTRNYSVMSRSRVDRNVRMHDLTKEFDAVPAIFPGLWISASYLKTADLMVQWMPEQERAFLIRVCMDLKKFLYIRIKRYETARITEEDDTLFPPLYQESWYKERLTDFWIPFMLSFRDEKGRIPLFIQYQAFSSLCIRAEKNKDNRNKHVIPEAEAEDYLRSWKPFLEYLDDSVILNKENTAYANLEIGKRRALLRIKYEDDALKLTVKDGKENLTAGFGKTEGIPIDGQVNVQAFDITKEGLHIDAVLPNPLDDPDADFAVEWCGERIPVTFTGRYAHLRLFGIAVCRNYPFEAVLPIKKDGEMTLRFLYETGGKTIVLPIRFNSHFSRLSDHFLNNYWAFRWEDGLFMADRKGRTIRIRPTTKGARCAKEVRLWMDMIKERKRASLKFLILRMAVFFLAPFYRNRHIWFYMDKIYKGGDSSEYLCRYSSARKDGIHHVYLIDPNAPEYEKLKADGIEVAKRKSIKHRLDFIFSDYVICSNSTVFAFNNYSMNYSSYVRDLFHFRCVCVQHGMSVQKIAIAQNRLRDNTKLYFCASKYEIENLSHPIYDYAGRNILKMTGVPRHDGLTNRDQKQILISPTWRMQAAVRARKSEGEQREYNPYFKNTEYFKAYNSLINNKELLDTAKRLGYKILYVLHPVVSSQAGDFDRNETVKIIPSTGDFSYEKAFCESSLMVTDYSGIQFDFAYMRKPVVYYHNERVAAHYEEGTFRYDTMAFGEICKTEDEIVRTLIGYMHNDCRMKDMYVRRADDFFTFSDHKNCERIYQVMREDAVAHFDCSAVGEA